MQAKALTLLFITSAPLCSSRDIPAGSHGQLYSTASGDGRELKPWTSRWSRRMQRLQLHKTLELATETAAFHDPPTSDEAASPASFARAVRLARGGGAGAPEGYVEASMVPPTGTTAAAAPPPAGEANQRVVSSVATAASTESAGQHDRTGGLANNLRVLGYFALWYALNVWYNIVNKKVLNALPLPVTIAVAQLGIGSLWVSSQWWCGARTRPGKLSEKGVHMLTPVAFFHGGGQLATVLSLGAGAVSFTHVVKAMEPFFSALVAAVWFRQIFRWQVYMSLLPVVAGVALACAKEINFSWVSFLAAMTSNLFFACRSNFSKALMIRPPVQGGSSISAANLYALVTLTAFVIFAPVAVITGWGKLRPAWEQAMESGHKGKALAASIFLSGISHYLNNEVMYLALGAVHPTTLAVGNTMKRVFIVVASLIVFKTPMSKLGMVGSAVAVVGVLVYSLTKQYFDHRDAEDKRVAQRQR